MAALFKVVKFYNNLLMRGIICIRGSKALSVEVRIHSYSFVAECNCTRWGYFFEHLFACLLKALENFSQSNKNLFISRFFFLFSEKNPASPK